MSIASVLILLAALVIALGTAYLLYGAILRTIRLFISIVTIMAPETKQEDRLELQLDKAHLIAYGFAAAFALFSLPIILLILIAINMTGY